MQRLAAIHHEMGVPRGIKHVLAVLDQLIQQHPAWATYNRLLRSNETFTFRAQAYPYCFHPYNWTWANERAVEVPIAARQVRNAWGGRVLEVGNVLNHYRRFAHDIVDRYEQAPGVMNVDVLDYRPAQPYDLIVSISTLEHVGWDEAPRDPTKVLRAVDHLTALLAPGGQLVVTFPVSHHPELDRLVREDELPFDTVGYLRRRGLHRWAEVPRIAAVDAPYRRPYRGAEAVVVGLTTQH